MQDYIKKDEQIQVFGLKQRLSEHNLFKECPDIQEQKSIKNYLKRADIKYKTQIGVCVQQAFKYRGYSRAENSQKWDIFWAEKESINHIQQNYRITPGQKLNHFRTYYEVIIQSIQLCRKDNLNRNLKKYKKNLEKESKQQAKEFNFFPLTYQLPIEFNIFAEEFKKSQSDKNNVWIMKPVSKSQGKGIFLFNKLSSISEWSEQNSQSYIVQRYIVNPLLVGGKKFDLRLYVLTTSYKPLTVYLYREGFARFTTQKYDGDDIQNSEVHLTNVAIQKHSSEYNKDNGGKWQLKTLKLYLISKYGYSTVHNSFIEIQKLIIKTLKCMSKIMSAEKNCFQLYGFDILIDDTFKPWLIQVNGSPSMRANTKEDKKLKIGIIDDVLTIVDLEEILTGKQPRIGGFDMICQEDQQKRPTDKFSDPFENNTFLGCINNRKRCYFELAHEINKKANFNRTNRQISIESPAKKSFSVRKQNTTIRPILTLRKQNPEDKQKPREVSSSEIFAKKDGHLNAIKNNNKPLVKAELMSTFSLMTRLPSKF